MFSTFLRFLIDNELAKIDKHSFANKTRTAKSAVQVKFIFKAIPRTATVKGMTSKTNFVAKPKIKRLGDIFSFKIIAFITPKAISIIIAAQRNIAKS